MNPAAADVMPRVDAGAERAASLIVTIDTEEEGLWSGQYASDRIAVSNIAAVPRFQQLCDDFGIVPTYLVNSPVVESAAALAVLAPVHDSGRCEIGAHIHPWNTPPVSSHYDAHSSYLCNLPGAEQADKLATVTTQIERAFGVRPRSFRAGRYGLDVHGARLLTELGYLVDSSVCPFTDYSADGGPDFRGAPYRPYWVGESLLRPGPPGGLLEVPVSFGFNRRHFELAARVHGGLQHAWLRRLRATGILDRLGLLQKIKFSPEKADATRLVALAESYARNRTPCMVLMFHSSSLMPGQTPYVRSMDDLERFLDNLRKTFAHCLGTLGMRPATLTGFAQAVRERAGLPTARA